MERAPHPSFDRSRQGHTLPWRPIPAVCSAVLLCAQAHAQVEPGQVGLNFIRFGSASVNTSWDEPDEVFPDFVALGCQSIRQIAAADVNWWSTYLGGNYADPASYDFSGPDLSIRNTYGIGVVPTLFQIGGDSAVNGGAPDKNRLYTPDGEVLDVTDPLIEAKVRGYVRVMAERYLGEVRYWEVANEVAAYGQYTPKMYADLLVVCADELEQVDPDNQVVVAGIAGTVNQVFLNHTDWLEQVILAGGGAGVDVYNYHYYDAWDLMLPSVLALKAMLASHGEGDKPLWATELGSSYIPSSVAPHSPTGSPEEQAADVFRRFAVAAGNGAEFMCWHTWLSSSEAPGATWSGFGLRMSTGTPVRSRTTYALYTEALTPSLGCTPLSEGTGGIWAYRYDVAEGSDRVRRWVAWCDEATGTASLDLTEASTLRVRVTEVVPDGAGDLTTRVDHPAAIALTPYPVLIEATCAAPQPYGQAKLTSLGTSPLLGWTGTASLSSNDLTLTVSGAVPGQVALVLHGAERGSLPFFGGELLVSVPFVRLSPFALDAAGSGQQSFPVEASLLGTSRCFQTWFRDPAHPDGTGVGLSSALEVEFCQRVDAPR
jgi:hypothetical protein